MADDIHINPIVDVVSHAFKTMAGVEPRMVGRSERSAPPTDHEVAGIVVVSGVATGRLVLSMPADTAVRTVSRILDEKIASLTGEVVDGIGEMSNVISSRMKTALSKLGIEGLTLSLPKIVVGRTSVAWPEGSFPYTSLSFVGDGLGAFSVDVKLGFTAEALAGVVGSPVVVKVLVVDDSAMVRKLVRNVLSRMTSPRVELHEAGGGDEALEAIRRAEVAFDMVLLDLNLPRTDGMSVLKALKTDPATYQTPVVVLSGDVADETVNEAMSAGAAGFLVKPFRAEELRKLVSDVTEP